MKLEELSAEDISRLIRIVDSEHFKDQPSAIDIWYIWATGKDEYAYRPYKGLFGDRDDMDKLMEGWEAYL